MKGSSFVHPLRALIGLFGCALMLSATASTLRTLDDPALAARVNGEAIHAFTFQAMLHASQDSKPRPTPAAVLDELVAERLLASWARKRFTSEELYPATRVGFAREAALDDKLVGLLRSMYPRELEAALHALPGGDLNGLVADSPRLDAATLERLFGKPGRMRLDYTLDAGQEALAARVPLLRYTLGGQPGTLTVLDVLRRQNVQGRMEFFNHNVDFMQQGARTALAGLFVQDWAARRFGAPALADLRRALSDQDDVHAVRALYGLAGHAESESRVQAGLAQGVTRAEIGAYYAANREQFRRTLRVKARHIRVPDEATAAQVVAAASKGQDFAGLARRFSIAPDAQSGGDLGWVHQTGNPDWLSSLVLLQPRGRSRVPSAPPSTATRKRPGKCCWSRSASRASTRRTRKRCATWRARRSPMTRRGASSPPCAPRRCAGPPSRSTPGCSRAARARRSGHPR
ncbi:hypothetical protein G4G28_16920 [Massilia sp. Dwa41.01b]|uniref:peptidylprolyl isomerase n=1 Tax=Massilia sp. Dwa41.01b TaxID=2709302 RepID=UPI001603D552|nr:peptidylprolyl isomerase [Massilia sp. Dwa41.01b]QNA89738.1 hypothetical protein G4G28_16920 [Massilia sp. Dwa41.01b]